MQAMVVHVVEYDVSIGQWFAEILQSTGLQVAVFPTADAFLANMDLSPPSCLVLDVLLPGMTGLELQDHLNERRIGIPIIFVSAFADVPTAVRAMKAGALDFLEKPIQAQVLLAAVQNALSQHKGQRVARCTAEEILGLMARLTAREREVMGLVMAGLSNKEMARKLGVSPKTIEAHRAKLYTKMRADSLADLVRKGLEGAAYQ
jgi:two-component system response regulator FixJ